MRERELRGPQRLVLGLRATRGAGEATRDGGRRSASVSVEEERERRPILYADEVEEGGPGLDARSRTSDARGVSTRSGFGASLSNVSDVCVDVVRRVVRRRGVASTTRAFSSAVFAGVVVVVASGDESRAPSRASPPTRGDENIARSARARDRGAGGRGGGRAPSAADGGARGRVRQRGAARGENTTAGRGSGRAFFQFVGFSSSEASPHTPSRRLARPLPPCMVTETTCAKLCTLSFALGVAVGFAFNNKLRRWLS